VSDPLARLLPRARRRLERLALYPTPLRADVEIVVWPWFFELPWYRRYVAYALMRRVILSATPEELIARRGEQWLEDLLVHELCHVWQVQHHPIRTGAAHLRFRYRENPFEIEARTAAKAEKPAG
jgi:hypothetical protein